MREFRLNFTHRSARTGDGHIPKDDRSACSHYCVQLRWSFSIWHQMRVPTELMNDTQACENRHYLGCNPWEKLPTDQIRGCEGLILFNSAATTAALTYSEDFLSARRGLYSLFCEPQAQPSSCLPRAGRMGCPKFLQLHDRGDAVACVYFRIDHKGL